MRAPDSARRAVPPSVIGWAMRCALGAAAVVAVVALSRFPYDDAFIHMRIARNLAWHGAPYFNAGERVMGDSSPLWLTLLAAAFRVAREASPRVATVVAAGLLVLLLDASDRLLAHRADRSVSTALLSALVVGALVLTSAGGLMEPVLALVLLTWGVLAFARDRPGLAGLAFALAAATRLELWLAVVGAVALAPGWHRRWRVARASGAVFVGYAVVSAIAYGTLAPNTIRAKAIVYRVGAASVLEEIAAHSRGAMALALAALFVLVLALAVRRLVQASPARSVLLAAAAGVASSSLIAFLEGHALRPAAAALAVVCAAIGCARGRRLVAAGAIAVAAASCLEAGVVAAATLALVPGIARTWRTAAFCAVAVPGAALLAVDACSLAARHHVAWLMASRAWLSSWPAIVASAATAVAADAALVALLAAAAFVLGARPRNAADLADGLLARRAALLLSGFALVLLAAYVLRRTMVFPWYWPIALYPLAMGALLLIVGRPGAPVLAGVPRAALALALGVFLAQRAVHAWETAVAAIGGHPERAGDIVENARVIAYRDIAAELSSRCPDAVIMTPEIGAVGWSHSGKILDGVGLVSPEVLRYHPLDVPLQRCSSSVGAVPAEAVVDLRPDLVLAMEVFASDLVRDGSLLHRVPEYKLVRRVPVFGAALRAAGFPRALWGSRDVLVFAREDAIRCTGPAEPLGPRP